MIVQDYIKKAAAESPRPIVLEIGAARCEDTNRNVDAILSAKSDGVYEYYAFEPDPRNIQSIKESTANKRVHLIPCAVGASNSRAMFNQSGGANPTFGYEHTLSGSLKKPVDHLKAHPWCKFDTQTEVRVVTLDAFHEFFSLPYIDFIWCDVQGAEDLVIEGGSFALANTRFFYTEYYNHEMYQGQIPAQEIHRRLPGQWRVVEQWSNDILFENLCFQRSQSSAQLTVG